MIVEELSRVGRWMAYFEKESRERKKERTTEQIRTDPFLFVIISIHRSIRTTVYRPETPIHLRNTDADQPYL